MAAAAVVSAATGPTDLRGRDSVEMAEMPECLEASSDWA